MAGSGKGLPLLGRIDGGGIMPLVCELPIGMALAKAGVGPLSFFTAAIIGEPAAPLLIGRGFSVGTCELDRTPFVIGCGLDEWLFAPALTNFFCRANASLSIDTPAGVGELRC